MPVKVLNHVILTLAFFLASTPALAGQQLQQMDPHLGIAALFIFIFAYALVVQEEFIGLRKSKPVILAAGLIWILVSIAAQRQGVDKATLKQAVEHYLAEYSALLLFLLTAMTYINAMDERNVFKVLRCWILHQELSYRQLFWLIGFLTFFISPVADNLTTALLMGSVVLSIAHEKPDIITLFFINIVVAANAGGAFSPFGDITTLMVWQSEHANFFDFFKLFLPALVNFIIPCIILSLALPDEKPSGENELIKMKPGAKRIILLFILTICTAVIFEQFLHLPPFLGMMTGLSYLMFLAYYLHFKSSVSVDDTPIFNIFNKIARAEWDTLLFFFGVIFSVGGLGFLGYLTWLSDTLYIGVGATTANISVGFISAIIDNIPIMVAVINMQPEMNLFQWLLVTLTAGVGGSLLSIGSAAGVALMGQSRKHYTFFNHLRWSWAILIGYVASITMHFLLNS